MKLKNKKYVTYGDKRLSQEEKTGGTNGNFSPSGQMTLLILIDHRWNHFHEAQLCEMRKTLEKSVKSKKLDSWTSLQNSQDLVTKCTANNGSYHL